MENFQPIENMQVTSNDQSKKTSLSPEERKSLLEARFGQSSNNVLLEAYSPNQKVDHKDDDLKEKSSSKMDVSQSYVNPDDVRIQGYDSVDVREGILVDFQQEPAQQHQVSENLDHNWSNGNNSKSNLKRKLDKHDLPIKSPQSKAAKQLGLSYAGAHNQPSHQPTEDSNQGRDGNNSILYTCI